jgi:hypothetical protein
MSLKYFEIKIPKKSTPSHPPSTYQNKKTKKP